MIKARRWAGVAIFNLFLFILLFELAAWAYVSMRKPYVGYLANYPTYVDLLTGTDPRHAGLYDPLGPHVIDTALPWSLWHPRNSSFRHRRPCFDVMMQFNREGTRGALPDPGDSASVFFLGDSFTEGFGLPEDSTLPVQYGRTAGVPVLNLGVAGLSTTQHSLIYEHFAPRYRHRRVFVVLFLVNDFMDNDIDRYAAAHKADRRFRPYRADTSDLTALVYMGSPDSSLFSWRGFLEKRSLDGVSVVVDRRSFLSKVYNLTYSSRLIRVLALSMRRTEPNELAHDARDLRILEYDLRRIMETADRHGAQVTVVNIPGLDLLLQAPKSRPVEERYLALEGRLSAMIGKGPHRFVSYYRHLRDVGVDPTRLVFTCDAHFNATGTLRFARFLAADPPTAKSRVVEGP